MLNLLETFNTKSSLRMPMSSRRENCMVNEFEDKEYICINLSGYLLQNLGMDRMCCTEFR